MKPLRKQIFDDIGYSPSDKIGKQINLNVWNGVKEDLNDPIWDKIRDGVQERISTELLMKL